MHRKVPGPVVLVVLDGWGLREDQLHNGVALASTPCFDHLLQTYPFTKLAASGEAVGLPEGQMGNSEVGHTTIGAGTVLYQDLVRITKDADSGAFAQNPAFVQAFHHVKQFHSQLHILGLLSSGGVHSHENHFMAAIKAAKAAGVKKIIVHPFLDGRDTPKTAGSKSLLKLEELVAQLEGCEIGSVMGRYFAMDRDTNWERTDKAWKAIFNGEAEHVYDSSISPSQLIQEKYHQEIFDEHMEPIVFKTAKGEVFEVESNDAIILTNFRKDRSRQLSQRVVEHREDKNLCFVTMTEYHKDLQAVVAYTPAEIKTTLGELISQAKLKQVHIAETEKFPHATYFLNGGVEKGFEGEEDVLIPSRKDVKTHDEAPEMKAKEICDAALERLGRNDFFFINFANPDMVGHTANSSAIVTAIEVVDRELCRLTEEVLKLDGTVIVIADHGNAEVMVDPVTGEPHTAHTINPVPCILVANNLTVSLRNDDAGLRDVAPTVLDLLGIEQPEAMSGSTLLT
ncbi:MAG: 2,3-bisphosphoglycerate-independent phosphoglycerate mutase [bacterium]|nr:2,3-bisphosphoglycerate-independent phosphoglycerate mutase [bacterium]